MAANNGYFTSGSGKNPGRIYLGCFLAAFSELVFGLANTRHDRTAARISAIGFDR